MTARAQLKQRGDALSARLDAAVSHARTTEAQRHGDSAFYTHAQRVLFRISMGVFVAGMLLAVWRVLL